MNNLERYIIYGVLILLILFLLFRKPQTNSDNITVKLNYDSIPKTINNSVIEKPVIYKPGSINIPPAELKILQNSTDTGLLKTVLKELLDRYYTVYTQTTVSTSDSVDVTTYDTISQNRIIGRKLQYKLKFPVSSTTIVKPDRTQLFAGFTVEAGAAGMYNAGPNVSLLLKKGTMVSLEYNAYKLFTRQDPYSFQVTLSQRIRLKK